MRRDEVSPWGRCTLSVHRDKIELLDVEPMVWRRIEVPSYYKFWDLHVAIQDAMGWQDRHLLEGILLAEDGVDDPVARRRGLWG